MSRLSSASGNFLGDTELVENLETTKRTAAEIEDKVLFFFYKLIWSIDQSVGCCDFFPSKNVKPFVPPPQMQGWATVFVIYDEQMNNLWVWTVVCTK